MSFGAAALRAVLEGCLPRGATGLVVALSGGLDSSCLAVALGQLAATPVRHLPLRAVHVDHGLQPAAADFREACTALCRGLGVALSILTVHVDVAPGASIEAAARTARYSAIARALGAGECLLTAHHAQDQAETVMLQLLRGTGLPGLAAMPACRAFGDGWHVRPLLDVGKPALLAFAREWHIEAVADPMNSDPRFDRAYLRAQVWPAIEARWPGATGALSRTARHSADAQVLLDESAAAVVGRLRDGNALSLTGLRALSAAQQRNALRHWIAIEAKGALPPSSARLTEALRQFNTARADHLPSITWGMQALRRYRGRVFLTPATPPQLEPHEWLAQPDAALALGHSLGTLRWVWRRGGLDAARLPATLQVRRRAGGETLKAHPRACTRSVQHLHQSLGVLPWMRDAVPMVFAGGALVAVGDLWLDARWCVEGAALGLGLEWDAAPMIV